MKKANKIHFMLSNGLVKVHILQTITFNSIFKLQSFSHLTIKVTIFRSIPHEYLEKINMELESDVMIRAIHDVKGIDMGNSLIRYKAEVDFDGRELTRSYLDKQDLNTLLEVR